MVLTGHNENHQRMVHRMVKNRTNPMRVDFQQKLVIILFNIQYVRMDIYEMVLKTITDVLVVSVPSSGVKGCMIIYTSCQSCVIQTNIIIVLNIISYQLDFSSLAEIRVYWVIHRQFEFHEFFCKS